LIKPCNRWLAMANTDGGTIIFGVDDPQKTTLKGAERIFGIEENIELYDELGGLLEKFIPQYREFGRLS